MIVAEEFLAERTSLMKAFEIRELLKWAAEGKVNSFCGGIPDPNTFPILEISEIIKKGLNKHGSELLLYGPTDGLKDLACAAVKKKSYRKGG